MTTSRSSARRSGTASSWIVVAVGFVAYIGLVFALAMAQIRLDVPLPAWVSQALSPLAYAVLVFLVVRPPSAASLVGGTLLLWCAQLVLGMLTEAFAGIGTGPGGAETGGLFPPPPLPALLWAVLLLVPLRDMLGRDPRGRGARPVSASPTRPPVARTPVPAVTPTTPLPVTVPVSAPTAKPTPFAAPRPADAKSMPEPRRLASAEVAPPPPPMAEPIAAKEQEQPASAAVAPTGGGLESASATRPRPFADDLNARDASDDPIRVSFGRVAAQLPPEGFLASLEEVGTHLENPGRLLVPRRVALDQLAQGVVRAAWDVVADQFPRHLISMTNEEIKGRLAGGELILPIDEIVGQLPTELFRSASPVPEVRGIELFPAPFHPVSLAVETTSPEIVPAAAPAPMSEERLVDPGGPSAFSLPEPTPEIAGPPSTPPPPDPIPAPLEAARTGSPGIDMREALPAAAPAGPAAVPSDDEGPDVSGRSRIPGSEPSWASQALPSPLAAHGASSDGADIREARALASAVVPPGTFEVRAGTVDGVKIFSITSPDVDEDLATTVARLLLPVLAEGRAPWPVDQITLRGAGAAVVLTPLALVGAGGAVLAAAVPRGGALALLEMRCRQATVGYASRGAAAEGGAAGTDDREEPDLLDVEPATRVREVASSLGALGPVTASALRDTETDRALYLFLPPGSDVRGMGALASDVCRAMRQAHEAGAVFRTAVLTAGARRMVVRLPAGLPGRTPTIVAAGETTRPGLAYRQVERAAAALGAL